MNSGHTTAPYAYGYSTSLSTTTYKANQAKGMMVKSLAGAGPSANPELAAWYEQAYAYYNAVMAGAEARPDPTAWNEFINQMNWAYQQLNGPGNPGSNWGEPGTPGMPYPGQGGMEEDPFGGMPGAMGTLVHTEEEARVGFTGQATRDFWSNDVTIDVAPLSATVTAERTTDTRSNPAEEVIKITVTDPATGTTAVYFIHDYADAQIKINVPNASQVNDQTGGLVEVGRFRQNGGSASNEVDVPFEEQDNGDLLIEVPYGQTVAFTPEGGENQTWDVYANFNISVRPSDLVKVSQDGQGGYVVTVEHTDGTFDTFKIHKDFEGNINGYPQNVQWGDPANGGGVGEEIPSEFRGDFTLNSTGPSATANPSTPPDETNGTEATYNSATDVDLYTDYDDEVETHRITAPGEVVIHGTSYADTARVTRLPDGRYRVRVYKNGEMGPNAEYETYYVDGASKIILDFLPDKIEGNGADDPIIQRGTGDYADTSQGEAQQVAQQLADLPGIEMSAIEIMEKAEQMGIHLQNLPAIPTQELHNFLVAIDPRLKQMYEDYSDAEADDAKGAIRSQVRNRLAELWSLLYPNAGVSASSGDSAAAHDNIVFNGESYDIFENNSNAGGYYFQFDQQDE